MNPLEHPRLHELLNDAFLDIADRIGGVLTAEFNKRKDPPPFFFNSGYSYTDFLGRIMSNVHGQFSDEDKKMAIKIVEREMRKLNTAEMFTLRLYVMETDDSNFHGSVVAAKFHILHNWAMTLRSGYNSDSYFMEDDCPLEVNYGPDVCPHCGGKVVPIVYGDLSEEILRQADDAEIVFRGGYKFPEDADWECLNCGGQFKLLENNRPSAK